MKVKTESGFEVKIDEDVMDNWEIMKSLRAIDKGDTAAIVDVAPLLLGEEQCKKLEEHIKKEHGKVKLTVMIQTISEILQSCNQLKNS